MIKNCGTTTLLLLKEYLKTGLKNNTCIIHKIVNIFCPTSLCQASVTE